MAVPPSPLDRHFPGRRSPAVRFGATRTRAEAVWRRSLAALREPFASLGRTEATIFQFRKRRREARDPSRAVPERDRPRRRPATDRRQDPDDPGPGRRARRRLADGVRPCSRAGSPPRRPSPLFENVAEKAGLARPHRAFLPNAAKNIPIPGEHMPPGAAVLDFDRDGRQDLFVPSGDGNRLYRNRGDGTFEDVAKAAGVAGQEGEGAGALAFDYDNDGDTDIYETYLLRPNLLYRNRGDGTFEEVGASAGVDLNDYSTSAAALDYDRDGDADLYVLVYGHPNYGPTLKGDNAPPNHLYRNDGNGKFTDVSNGDAHRRPALGPGSPVRGFRRRPLARHLRRQRLRRPHLLSQSRRRHVRERREEGRRPGPGLRHGRDRRRLRRGRPAGLLRVELLVPPQLVPERPALPHAALPLLSRPAARLAEADEALARLVSLSQSRRRPFHRHVRGGRRLGHLLVLGLRLRRRGPRRPAPTSSSSTAWSRARTRPSARSTSGT